MGAFTGLRITAEEQYLYGVLSQKPIEKTLSQQQLLAEVMLVMGNPNKRRDSSVYIRTLISNTVHCKGSV